MANLTGHQVIDVYFRLYQLFRVLVDDVVDLFQYFVQLLIGVVANVDEDAHHAQAVRLFDCLLERLEQADVVVDKVQLPQANGYALFGPITCAYLSRIRSSIDAMLTARMDIFAPVTVEAGYPVNMVFQWTPLQFCAILCIDQQHGGIRADANIILVGTH